MIGENEVIWFYAGLIAGLVSSSFSEPSYGNVSLFPLLLFIYDVKDVVVGFTVATAVTGLFNLIRGGLNIHPKFTLFPLIGVIAGVLAFFLFPPQFYSITVALILIWIGINVYLDVKVSLHGTVKYMANFLVGFSDAIFGTTLSFSLASSLGGQVLEALVPTLRGIEAVTELGLKEEVYFAGLFAGMGILIGQRLGSVKFNNGKLFVLISAIAGSLIILLKMVL